jgi:hypothetical protein
MKKFCLIVMVSFCVIGFLNGVTPIRADAAPHGKIFREGVGYCWNFSNRILEISGKIQLRFANIGDSSYLCSGMSTVTYPVIMQFPVYGNAELVGGEIYLTLSLAGIRNGVIGIDMQKAILDPTTLNGTFEYIGVYSSGVGESAAVEISEGTLTRTTCQ